MYSSPASFCTGYGAIGAGVIDSRRGIPGWFPYADDDAA